MNKEKPREAKSQARDIQQPLVTARFLLELEFPTDLRDPSVLTSQALALLVTASKGSGTFLKRVYTGPL